MLVSLSYQSLKHIYRIGHAFRRVDAAAAEKPRAKRLGQRIDAEALSGALKREASAVQRIEAARAAGVEDTMDIAVVSKGVHIDVHNDCRPVPGCIEHSTEDWKEHSAEIEHSMEHSMGIEHSIEHLIEHSIGIEHSTDHSIETEHSM